MGKEESAKREWKLVLSGKPLEGECFFLFFDLQESVRLFVTTDSRTRLNSSPDSSRKGSHGRQGFVLPFEHVTSALARSDGDAPYPAQPQPGLVLHRQLDRIPKRGRLHLFALQLAPVGQLVQDIADVPINGLEGQQGLGNKPWIPRREARCPAPASRR